MPPEVKSPSEAPSAPRYDAADPRIYFAAERTLLAWIRTGLAMMGFGFIVARFGLFLRMMSPGAVAVSEAHLNGSHSPSLSVYAGTAMVVLGVIAQVAAAGKYILTLRRLRKGQPVWQDRLSLELVVAILLALIGLMMAVYLFAASMA
jgi:putative membrane protein